MSDWNDLSLILKMSKIERYNYLIDKIEALEARIEELESNDSGNS